jgi:hypothetical protein
LAHNPKVARSSPPHYREPQNGNSAFARDLTAYAGLVLIGCAEFWHSVLPALMNFFAGRLAFEVSGPENDKHKDDGEQK